MRNKKSRFICLLNYTIQSQGEIVEFTFRCEFDENMPDKINYCFSKDADKPDYVYSNIVFVDIEDKIKKLECW